VSIRPILLRASIVDANDRPAIAARGSPAFEPVQPRSKRAAALVGVAAVARQRLVTGRQRAALGPGPDMVARRCSHRLAAIDAGLADGRKSTA
jgi:hypothetical protein